MMGHPPWSLNRICQLWLLSNKFLIVLQNRSLKENQYINNTTPKSAKNVIDHKYLLVEEYY